MPCSHYIEGCCRKTAAVPAVAHPWFRFMPVYKACQYGDVAWLNGNAFPRRPEYVKPAENCPEFEEKEVHAQG